MGAIFSPRHHNSHNILRENKLTDGKASPRVNIEIAIILVKAGAGGIFHSMFTCTRGLDEINFLSSQRAGKSSHHLTTLLGKYIFRQEKVAGLKISEPLFLPLKTWGL